MRKQSIPALLLALCLLLGGCVTAEKQPSAEPEQSQTVQPTAPEQEPAPSPTPTPTPEPVTARLLVAGDVMSHMPITNDAYVEESGSYDYSHMLQFAAEQVKGADYALANLETVLAGAPNYSGYPAFNSPDALAENLKAAGFDMVTTANNHSMDRGIDGVFRTLDVLDQAGLDHVGTYRSQEEREENRGIHVADIGGISVAFVDYTYGLNGYRLPEDKPYAVSLFNTDYYTTLANPDYDLIRADLEAARALDTDLIAVAVHWGVEYQNAPNEYQTQLAAFLVEQGADLVLGGHPHVLQPYETITVTGWDGEEREGFVCYSLGNFLSNQLDLETKTTVLLELELELTKEGDGETAVTGVSYVPYYMLHRDSSPAGDRRYLVPIHEAMDGYEQGQNGLIDAAAYQELQDALAHCHAILGEEGDRMQDGSLPQ